MKTTMDTPIKFIASDGSGHHSGHPAYRIGVRQVADGPLALCRNGFHVTTPRHWAQWANARCLRVEVSAERLTGADRACHRWILPIEELATWNPRSQRLLACQIAELVLPLFEVHHPNDDRPRKAIEAARRFARGEVGANELEAACAAAYAAYAAYAASDAASRAASDAAEIQHAEWFLATINGEINQA